MDAARDLGPRRAAARERAGFRVLAPDLRGFGDGARVAARRLLLLPRLRRSTSPSSSRRSCRRRAPLLVVGHSMGGTVATMYAGHVPRARVAPGWSARRVGPARQPARRTRPTGCAAGSTSVRGVRGTGERRWPSRDERARAPRGRPPARAARGAAHPRSTRCAPTLPDGRVAWKADPLHATRSPMPFFAETLQGVRPARVECPTLYVSGGTAGWHPPDEAGAPRVLPARSSRARDRRRGSHDALDAPRAAVEGHRRVRGGAGPAGSVTEAGVGVPQVPAVARRRDGAALATVARLTVGYGRDAEAAPGRPRTRNRPTAANPRTGWRIMATVMAPHILPYSTHRGRLGRSRSPPASASHVAPTPPACVHLPASAAVGGSDLQADRAALALCRGGACAPIGTGAPTRRCEHTRCRRNRGRRAGGAVCRPADAVAALAAGGDAAVARCRTASRRGTRRASASPVGRHAAGAACRRRSRCTRACRARRRRPRAHRPSSRCPWRPRCYCSRAAAASRTSACRHTGPGEGTASTWRACCSTPDRCRCRPGSATCHPPRGVRLRPPPLPPPSPVAPSMAESSPPSLQTPSDTPPAHALARANECRRSRQPNAKASSPRSERFKRPWRLTRNHSRSPISVRLSLLSSRTGARTDSRCRCRRGSCRWNTAPRGRSCRWCNRSSRAGNRRRAADCAPGGLAGEGGRGWGSALARRFARQAGWPMPLSRGRADRSACWCRRTPRPARRTTPCTACNGISPAGWPVNRHPQDMPAHPSRAHRSNVRRMCGSPWIACPTAAVAPTAQARSWPVSNGSCLDGSNTCCGMRRTSRPSEGCAM